jgi:dolichol-phosphate mannosyltransferase
MSDAPVADVIERPLKAAQRNLPALVSIVSPTFNEVANIPLFVAAIDAALGNIRWEIIFVDDNSPDGTAERVREIAMEDARVRVVHRYGRRGLSSACVEGIMASSAPYVIVMDSDLQHDEAIVPDMLEPLIAGTADLVVASRYVSGGGMGEWSKQRVAASQLATKFATALVKTPVSDPMSGFFGIRRDAFLRSLPKLSAVGFKILLDIAASAPTPLRVAEVPYTFRTRQHGESKLDSMVLWEYFLLLVDKTVGHIIPTRLVSFGLVGGAGVFVHFLILTTLFKGVGYSFAVAQGVATVVAITNNFILNNLLTYRDRRLRGKQLFWGWISFNLVCATGAAANVGVADFLFERPTSWMLSALAGIAVSMGWNYAMSSIFTWRKRSV